MKQVSLKRIEDYWLEQFGGNDVLGETLLDRYLNHVKNLRKLQKELNSSDIIVTTENSSQKFMKPHPALKEMRDIEAKIQSLEKQLINRAEEVRLSRGAERRSIV